MPSGVELATGYISIVAETSQIPRDVNRALGQAGRDAENTGRRIGGQLGGGINSSLGDVFKKGLATAGVVGGLAGLTSAFTSVVKSGNDFQSQLNEIKGVSGATASQMAQIRSRAKDLGTDIDIVGASSTDAAKAMTELVKAGFSVDQAMAGAKGTLQLASAAQVDAAEAATIQGRALMAFGLGADQAGMMADLLANAANASSGEITDFAQALQAGSAVAHQFGISAEDTTATLAMLANAGIAGSDAGTLLKSMLLAVASPSDQASRAMDELGLKVWDASGKFVGMREVMRQLEAASKSMKPEMYAMATSTAFGSDAARLAGVAASQGARGFDDMSAAMGKQGSAAQLAKTRTEGLPGVFERLSNTTEDLKLNVFGLIDGPLQAMGNGLVSVLDKVSDAVGGNEASGVIANLSSAASTAAPVLQKMGSALVDVVGTVGSSAWGVFEETLSGVVGVASMFAPVLQGVGGVLAGHTNLVAAAVGAWLLFSKVPPILTRVSVPLAQSLTRMGQTITGQVGALVPLRARLTAITGDYRNLGTAAAASGQQVSSFNRLMTAVSRNSPTVRNMGNAFIGASTPIGAFAGAARAGAQPALNGLRAAASGVVGALGGPFSAALIASTAAITLWASSTQDAKQRAEAFATSTNKIAQSQKAMYSSLVKTGGNVDDGVLGQLGAQIDAFNEKVQAGRRGAGWGDWMKVAVGGVGNFVGISNKMAETTFELQKSAEGFEAVHQAMQKLGMSSGDIAKKVTADEGTWQQFRQTLQSSGEGGTTLANTLGELRDNLQQSVASAKNVTPGMHELSESIRVLATESASAADKTNALKTALDVLAGKPMDSQKAMADFNKTILDQKAAMTDLSGVMLDQEGRIDTSNEAGQRLFRMLNDMYDATVNAAGAGSDMSKVWATNEEQLRMMGAATGLGTEGVRKLVQQMGLVPERVTALIEAKGAPETLQQAISITEKLKSIPPNTPVTIDPPSPDVLSKLQEIGAKIEFVERNGKQQVVISVDGDAQGKLAGIAGQLNQIATSRTFTLTGFINTVDAPLGSGASPSDPRPIPGGSGAGAMLDPNQLSKLPRKADGGPLYGAGPKGKDSILMWGAPGEHMLTDKDVDNMGGHAGVFAIRNAAAKGELVIPGYAGGGPIGGLFGNLFGGGQNPVDPKAVRNAENEMSDNSGALEVAKAKLAELQASGKASKSDLLKAQGSVDEATRAFQNSQADYSVIAAGGTPDTRGRDLQETARQKRQSADEAKARLDELMGKSGVKQSELLEARNRLAAATRDADQAAQDAAAPLSGADGRTEGYIPAGASGGGDAGNSMFSGFLNMGAEAINGLIDQAASAAATAASAAATAGSFGAGGQAAGPAAGLAIGIGANAAKRGVKYGFQMAGIGIDAAAEILSPFGVPRLFQTDVSQFMPQWNTQQAATTTAEQQQPTTQGVDPNTASHGTAAAQSQQAGLTGAGPAAQAAMANVATGQGTGPAPGPGLAPASNPYAKGAGGEQLPDWMRMLQGGGVYDDGGWLPPGGVGVNLSNKPEPVLNGRQWDQISAAAAQPVLPAEYGSNDYSVRVENVTVKDVGEMERELSAKQRLQMMRHAGRP
ncbi:phage tail tape measure protein [Mycolicibacterium fortuitum]|uniref:phage tail tape measure protein n=1 Tax=Mycolicibacterium fortuitum TaxID=1766 RepID=UPI0026164983|nr:phage tail tape measure protein [Mycolicibacterium fortuitum]